MPNVVHILDAAIPADALAQLLAIQGAQERIVSLGAAPTRLAGEGKTAKILPAKGLHATRALIHAARDADVLHCWSWPSLPTAVAAAKSLRAKRVVSLPALPTDRAARGALPWAITESGATLTLPTQAARNALLESRLDPNRVRVLPPVASACDPAPATRARVRAELGVPDEAVLLVAPAEMLHHAGHALASWAHAVNRLMHLPCHIWFPGTGAAQRSVRFFAHTTGFDDDVHFTGETYRRDEIEAAADIALFLYEKDLGLTRVAEALAAGLCVLAAPTDDLQEILRHDETAWLVRDTTPQQVAAGLLVLLDHPAQQQRLARAGRDYAQNTFTPAQARDALKKIYALAP